MIRLVYSPKYAADIGDHVFPTRKFALTAELMAGRAEVIEPLPPSREDLLLAHTPDWVDKVLGRRMTLDDELAMELPWTPAVSLAHQLQVSGTILACRLALENGVGLHAGGGSHHAFADHGEGFCVLNDIAVGILKLKREGLISRAAVIDLDVHHGNGTASILAKEPAVFTFSMHQENIYPAVKPPGSLDVGLEEGMADEAYLDILERHLPRVLDHKPELVVYQAGVDCAKGDALGGLRLTKAGLLGRDRMVLAACRSRRIPIAVTLGGGYSYNIKETAELHAQTLLEAMSHV